MASERELRATAVRVRRQIANPPVVHDDYERDTRLLAQAWLAEHPEDDGEPVTEEWFRSVVGGGDFQAWSDGSKTPAAFCDAELSIYIDEVGLICLRLETDLYGIDFLPQVKTRGDVRRLCRALGIVPKE